VFDLLDARAFGNVLVENVPNWRVLHGGQYLAEVAEAFEHRGYRWAYRTIDARAFGVPQRRLRVFFFASQERDPREAFFAGDAQPDERRFSINEAAHGFYWTEGNKGLGWGENCTPTLKGGSAIGIPAPPAVVLPGGTIITPHLCDGERLQGFQPHWTDLAEIRPELGGRKFNQRKRWVLIGNAVNVEASAWIAENLSQRSHVALPEGVPMKPGTRWPAAAWFDGKRRLGVDLGTWPVHRPQASLDEFLKYPGSLLSRRASEGFYKRIVKSPLRITPEFKAVVARHVERMERREKAQEADRPLVAAE
jgi:DNA (cytosine-5)-methyltransferase 1